MRIATGSVFSHALIPRMTGSRSFGSFTTLLPAANGIRPDLQPATRSDDSRGPSRALFIATSLRIPIPAEPKWSAARQSGLATVVSKGMVRIVNSYLGFEIGCFGRQVPEGGNASYSSSAAPQLSVGVRSEIPRYGLGCTTVRINIGPHRIVAAPRMPILDSS